LVFSFVGMRTEEVVVGSQTVINVTMVEETIGIDEVIAVGYGTQKKINLTGSVESIEGDDLARQPVAQASQALGGLVPGLTAIQSSGQPGRDNATLRIRGIGSIGASNNPLILIDGIEGDINNIDANDILNISVLKDAASASIYGSRASNGVILITTKRAQKSTMIVNYKNYIGWQDVTTKPEFLGALDFLRHTGSTQEEIDEYAANHQANPDIYPDTDWVDLLYSENGFQQYHNLSVNGGSENIGILASLSYIDQGANIRSYGFQRYNGRFNTDITLSEKFDINFDLSFHKSKSIQPAAGLSEVVRQAYRIPPIYHAIHSDGSWGYAWNSQNPIAHVTEGGYDNNFSNYFRGILKANYNPIPELQLSMMYAPEYNDGYNKLFDRIFYTIVDWEAKTTQKMPNRNSLSQENNRSFTDNFNALA
ncbi:MAG: SusC/RagA family TonB-linked outer membrane protein, partial [Mariniphaga sp.]